ncbi:MAG: hypothetical protein OQL08_08975 [Gammaproteobacteria bacterium]|nr:hypothetical protein [Gammaproteobacteria bacterium]
MIPLKTTLTGAIGIRAGLKRDTVTIDLGAVPDDAVTVALRGDNGMGKSTLLNLGLTPWREPDHVDDIYAQFGEAGARELEFEHGGRRYRSEIRIKQTAKTKSMKATLLAHTDDAGWQPYVMPDGTTSDGKNTTYDACLEHLLGPRSLYYMSAFRHQGARPLASHPDPKALMRDLLSLEEPEHLADQAKAVTRELRRALEARRSDIDRIGELRHRHGEIGPDLEQQQAVLPELITARRTADDAMADARRRYDEARQATGENAEIRRQADALQQRLYQAREAGTRQQQQLTTDMQRIRPELDSAHRAAVRLPLLEVAAREVDTLSATLQGLEDNRTALAGDVEQYRQADAEVARLETEIRHVVDAGKRHATTCQELQQRHGYVQTVPCHGDYPDCPALKDAIAAGDRLPDEEHARDSQRARWTELTAKLETVKATRSQHAAAREQMLSLEQEIRNTRAQLETSRREAAEIGAVKTTAERAPELERQLAELKQRAEQTAAEAQEAESVVQREIDDLPPLAPEDAAQAAANTLQQSEQQANAAAQAVEQTNAQIAALQAERDTLTRQLEQSATLEKQVEHINAEIAEWTLLAAALLGVIDLSIEDAGPAIAAHANHLLREAYGPRFTCRIVTQKQQANGVLKETFDISVIDAETGVESSILRKSGGETVWLDKAMRDAVGLYHQEAAGVHYECLFADEAEDGLTEERKEQFYRMDRAALDLGGYRRKFFISHNPRAWEMADHVIDLDDYRETN